MNNLMKELVDKLNLYAYHYYVLDNPIVSDKEYDALYDQLVKLEKESGIIQEDSPTRRIGGEPILKFGTHKHISKLYSLDKVQSTEELKSWYIRLVKSLKGIEPVLTVEHKLDGLTLCLTYEKGLYVRATTRGNGERGEDVTEQVKTIKGFPLRIDFQGLMEVQGEGIMRTSVFNEYNKTASETLKNPRNASAGAIRNLDPKVTAKRNLDIYFYNINYIEGGTINSQIDMMDFLAKNRFMTSEFFVCKTLDEVLDAVEKIDRTGLDYMIDGIVIKVNDIDLRSKLGYTDKFPRWAVAYKFEAEETTTIIKDVKWQVGRTGKLTPLAFLEPIELAGATVSRATLNNMGDIERKSVKIGSRVFVRRSNDVIPEITGLAQAHSDDLDIEIPSICPSCNQKLESIGANIFCVNFFDCPALIKGRLEHFVSKECMDIEGLSEKTIAQLYEKLNITSPVDLYKLSKEQLLTLEGFKDKKATNIINSIKNSKGKNLDAFINAIDIPNVGKKTSKDLAQKYQTMQAFMNAGYDELSSINEIGDVIALSIINFFKEHYDYVNQLIDIIKPVFDKPDIQSSISGKKLVITGTLEKHKRAEAHKIIEKLGGIVSDTVTKDTDFLIAGKDAGSKLDKAKRQGIEILSEQDFESLIND